MIKDNNKNINNELDIFLLLNNESLINVSTAYPLMICDMVETFNILQNLIENQKEEIINLSEIIKDDFNSIIDIKEQVDTQEIKDTMNASFKKDFQD